MNCRQCTDNLTAYLDGELSPAESAQVRSHLEVCNPCAAEWRSFQEAAAFVESHNRNLEIRPESWNVVYDRISAARSAPPFRFSLWKWSEMLATAAIVAALAFGYLWHQHNEKRSLDDYISQYVKSREAGFRVQTMNAFLPNPFAEYRPATDTNPFRLEDR